MKYNLEEFRQTLKRAFKGGSDQEYIVMDGRSAVNQYLRESWNYFNKKGYIKVENVDLEQESFMKGYITEKGKKWIFKED